MPCSSCSSENQQRFPAEMVIHLPGLKNLNKPSVVAFADLRICMDCGSKEFVVPESVPWQLGRWAATPRLHTSPTREKFLDPHVSVKRNIEEKAFIKCANRTARALGILGLLLLLSVPLFAQDTPVGPAGAEVATQNTPAAATNSDVLRNAAQNPIASLISVPIQDNFNFNIGPADRTQNVLNIQPVIPLKVSKDWNLIVRWIVPIIYQPIGVPQPSGPQLQNTGVYGLGDMNPTFFLSPSKPHKIIWGVGPTLVFPTATNTTYLGQGKFSMGPSVVALVQPKHWTIGFLANNIWSVAGQSDFNSAGAVNKPPVNQFLIQWFANYNMKKGWYLTTSPIITANWRAPSGDVWTVPWGGGVGRIMKVGFQPVNITAQFYANPTRPANTSPWGMRLQFVLLFPKLSKEQEKGLLEQKLKQLNQEQPQKN